MSFSNVVAFVALVLALSGGAYAAGKLERNSVGSKQVRPDSLTGADIKEGRLGTVPSAARAATAADAELLDGRDSSAFAERELAWTPVAEAHQSSSPPGRFTCFGSDGVVCDSHFGDGVAGHAAPAFSRDGFGIVRLQGTARFTHPDSTPVNPGPLFRLPAGFRPPDRRIFIVPGDDGQSHRLDVGPDGAVTLFQDFSDGDWFALDGLDFPCGPSGAAGCP